MMIDYLKEQQISFNMENFITVWMFLQSENVLRFLLIYFNNYGLLKTIGTFIFI